MRVYVNGDPQTLDDAATVAALLERHELAPQRVAVEVNERLVKRTQYAQTPLREGDRVEIVTLVGGG